MPLIWDGRNQGGAPVIYTPGSAPTGGQGSLPNYVSLEGGTLSPSIPPGRITTVPALGLRTGYCMQEVCYDGDASSVMPVGSSSNPAAAALSPRLITPTSNYNTWITGSTWFSGPGNPRGVNAFPLIPGFFQFFEVFGPPFTISPPWSLCVRQSGSANYAIIPSQLGTAFPNYWKDSSPLAYECWNDYVIHLQFAATPSADGFTGGLIEFWWGPNNQSGVFGATLQRQTFNTPPGNTLSATGNLTSGLTAVTGLAITGLSSPYVTAVYTVSGAGVQPGTTLTITGTGTATLSQPATASGTGVALTLGYTYGLFNANQTLGICTAPPGQWNGTPNSAYYNNYRTAGEITGAADPITIYHAEQKIAPSYADAVPSAGSVLRVGRISLGGPPSPISETVSDPIGALGGAVVPAPRQPYQIQLALATYLNSATSLYQGQVLRRQLRSLLNNSILKLQRLLYVSYSDDQEQDGWYAPDATTLAGIDKASWLARGLWQTQQSAWSVIGRRRTHREARKVWMKDLRTGSYDRDTLGWIRSTDFSTLPALAVSILPHGATAAALTVSNQALALSSMPLGRDGGICQLAQGLADLQVVSYERSEASQGMSDVIVYDRRGQLTNPSTGPDSNWEEVYGPDYPWNWHTNGEPIDTPVLDNGLVRVRWSTTNTPGFAVDVWTAGGYVEQGKLVILRNGDTAHFDDTLISAGLHSDTVQGGYTPERAVLNAVLSASADPISMERVYVTVQRGEMRVRFECYPALKSAGGQANVDLVWQPALNSGAIDVNSSVFKSDSATVPAATGTGHLVATAGSGSSNLPGGVVGNATFSASENFVSLLRCPTAYNVVGPYQASLSVLQAATAFASAGTTTAAYGVTDTQMYVGSNTGAGYLSAHLHFAATQPQQVLEAEAMTLGTNWASAADASASGGSTAQTTQTADTGTLSQATWPNSFQATYRVFVRAKATVSSTVYAKTGTTTGSNVTVASASYQWYDLGEIVADGGTLNLHGWCGSAGTLSIDRMEAFLLTDTARSGAIYSGCRDAGQRILAESRMIGALVAR